MVWRPVDTSPRLRYLGWVTDDLQDTIHLHELLGQVLRAWRFLLACMIIGASIGVAVALWQMTLPKTYTIKTELLFSGDELNYFEWDPQSRREKTFYDFHQAVQEEFPDAMLQHINTGAYILSMSSQDVSIKEDFQAVFDKTASDLTKQSLDQAQRLRDFLTSDLPETQATAPETISQIMRLQRFIDDVTQMERTIVFRTSSPEISITPRPMMAFLISTFVVLGLMLGLCFVLIRRTWD